MVLVDELEFEELDTSVLIVEFEAANAVFEEQAADTEAYAYFVGVGQNEAALVGHKDMAAPEPEGRLDCGQVAVQQVEPAVVVGELAPASGIAEQTVLVPGAVIEVEAVIVVGAELGVEPGAELGVDHRLAGIVELQTVDRGNNVDTAAVGMDLVQDTAGNTVDIVAADTIALLLAAQQFEL